MPGWTRAIINPAHVTPYADIPADQIAVCEDLIFNRDEDALARFIQFYEQTAATETRQQRADPTEGMTVDAATALEDRPPQQGGRRERYRHAAGRAAWRSAACAMHDAVAPSTMPRRRRRRAARWRSAS